MDELLDRFAQNSNITFDDVAGMENLKEEIKLNIIYPFMHPEIYIQYGKKAGGGILLYGPPGCGKTYIAKATANECNATFINISIIDVLDMYIGESERKLHEIFDVARRKSPAVVFIDEVDALGNDRMKSGDAVYARTLVNQLLNELDGIQSENDSIMIMGATNVPWYVDSALKRPGRFDKTLFVPPPDLKAREETFKISLTGKPIENINYAELAKITEKYSPADIVAVCNSAVDKAIKDAIKTGNKKLINNDLLKEAIREINPSTLEWLKTAENYVKYSNQSGLYDDVLKYLTRRG